MCCVLRAVCSLVCWSGACFLFFAVATEKREGFCVCERDGACRCWADAACVDDCTGLKPCALGGVGGGGAAGWRALAKLSVVLSCGYVLLL